MTKGFYPIFESMKRIFLAIKIEPDPVLLQKIEAIRLQIGLEKIRWVPPDVLHLTIKFFGETAEEKIPTIFDVIESVVKEVTPFSFSLKGIGLFGSRYDPRVIWAGVSEGEHLVRLAEMVIDQLDNAGYLRDRQNFVPHITLGRIKHIKRKEQLNSVVEQNKEMFFQKVFVKKILLYETIFNKVGIKHIIIKEFFLS